MIHPPVSRKKANAISGALFIVALVITACMQAWWPGMMLAVGIPLAFRQYFLGKRYDVLVTLFVFIGSFLSVQKEFSWPVFLPVLFILGAIYVFYRDMIENSLVTEEEHDEDVNEEIEENQHEK